MTVRLQKEPIDTAALQQAVQSDAAGACVLFVGTVRNHNRDRQVRYLEYGAYEEMAERQLQKLRDDTLARYQVQQVAISHRIGRMEIGEASVAIAVSSAHRADAFDACRYAIDTLKQTVPIWKKEFFEGGEAWIEDDGGSEPRPLDL